MFRLSGWVEWRELEEVIGGEGNEKSIEGSLGVTQDAKVGIRLIWEDEGSIRCVYSIVRVFR
jgi:hypothetical protein